MPHHWVHQILNEKLKTTEPAKIVILTSGATLALIYVYNQLVHQVPIHVRAQKTIFRLVKKLPMVRKKIEDETQKVRENFEKEMLEPTSTIVDVTKLPPNGSSAEEIVKRAEEYLGCGHFDWTQGSQSGTVYNGNVDLTELMTKVYGMAAWTNPLHPDAFPGVRKMEAEIVRMCCDLFQGGPDSCGTVTSGGTESIVLACKAYRDWAQQVKGIEHPNMIVPITAHAAFDKASQMLGIHMIHIPVDPLSQKVNLKKMYKAINRSTCLLVGSAPQFPHGSIDDIVEIAKLGLKYGIPVHVDACLGGFLIAFMKDAGYPLKPFDFSVPGVTSISADTHKYGFAPKGSSVIMYSKSEYRHYQWFTFPDWPGGIYATATISGSRAGGIIAACWAALVYYGKQGYVDATRKIIQTTRYITRELLTIDGIYIVGEPDVSVIAIGSDEFNIYGLSDGMKQRGWNLNVLQFPTAIHLCVTLLHTKAGVADRFVKDIREIAEEALKNPDAFNTGSAAVYGMAQSIPDRSVVDQITWSYLDSLYAVGSNKSD